MAACELGDAQAIVPTALRADNQLMARCQAPWGIVVVLLAVLFPALLSCQQEVTETPMAAELVLGVE